MEVNKIYKGDCLSILKTLPDNSINCCVTSPPYYALRDYGTGEWVGGDPNSDHVANPSATKVFGNPEFNCDSREQTKTAGYYKTVCPKCGAVRLDSQIGLEETPQQYIEKLTAVFAEVYRVLTDDGTCWVNLGDTYAGSGGGRGTGYHDARTDVVQSGNKGFNDMTFAPKITNLAGLKPKELIGIPWMFAFAQRETGWYLRQDIIWSKPNPMPESVKDRFTKSHEYIFLLTKSGNYYFDHEAVQETADPKNALRYNSPFNVGAKEVVGGGRPFGASNTPGMKEYTGKRNKRSVWNVVPSHYKEAHFATFPEELVYPMIMAGCPKDGIVLDPFMGSGTVAVVAKQNHRNYVGCELNDEYIKMAENRLKYTMKRLF